MPPLLAAAEMLASPVANRTIPQASALPILGLVVAGPAATGPFMLKATGASTGPWPRAQPAINVAQDNTSTKLFNMAFPFSCGPLLPHRRPCAPPNPQPRMPCTRSKATRPTTCKTCTRSCGGALAQNELSLGEPRREERTLRVQTNSHISQQSRRVHVAEKQLCRLDVGAASNGHPEISGTRVCTYYQVGLRGYTSQPNSR